MKGDQRGNVHQHAAGPASSRPEWLTDRACKRALGRVEQWLHRPQIAAGGCYQRLNQQQPGTGPDQVSGEP